MPTLSNTPPHRRRNRRARIQPRRTPHADAEGHSARQHDVPFGCDTFDNAVALTGVPYS